MELILFLTKEKKLMKSVYQKHILLETLNLKYAMKNKEKRNQPKELGTQNDQRRKIRLQERTG